MTRPDWEDWFIAVVTAVVCLGWIGGVALGWL